MSLQLLVTQWDKTPVKLQRPKRHNGTVALTCENYVKNVDICEKVSSMYKSCISMYKSCISPFILENCCAVKI